MLGSRTKTRLGARVAREPDILFVSAARAGIVQRLEVAAGPDLAVEIIGSDKGRSEALAKVPQYERAGVAELWLIDLLRRQVHLLRLEPGGYAETLRREGDALQSSMVDGFQLDVSLLFSAPGKYPSAWPILQRLLGEGEAGSEGGA